MYINNKIQLWEAWNLKTVPIGLEKYNEGRNIIHNLKF